ncbi:hypothetical protein KKF91_11500 [Myxococcota bacterium]|nr:hypothetical protein [Myxococcota bacterium]
MKHTLLYALALPLLTLCACDDDDGQAPASDLGALRDATVLKDAARVDGAQDQGLADATPVAPDATPVEPDAAPAGPDAAPVEPDAAPVEPDAAPVEPDAAPAGPDQGLEVDAGPQGDVLGTLAVNCAVPYVLDAAQVSDGGYMAMHFEHLVQQYCVTGDLHAVALNEHPEKMFYGTHAQDGVVSLQQVSMSAFLAPQFSVRLDFAPDADIVAHAPWVVDDSGTQAMAMLIEHKDLTGVCLRGVGVEGTLSFDEAVNLTATEGGRFTVAGQITIARPSAAVCARLESVRCCAD